MSRLTLQRESFIRYDAKLMTAHGRLERPLIWGMACIGDLFQVLPRVNFAIIDWPSAEDALASDWLSVGCDIQNAMATYAAELPSDQRQALQTRTIR